MRKVDACEFDRCTDNFLLAIVNLTGQTTSRQFGFNGNNYFVIINTPHQVPTQEILDVMNDGQDGPAQGWIMPRMESLAAVLAQMDIPMRFDICPFDTSIWATISHHHAKFTSETAMKILKDLHAIIDVLLKKPETLIRDLVKKD